MAIVLRTPTHNRNRWFEFEVINNQIQIRSIQEDGVPDAPGVPGRPAGNYNLGVPFYYRLKAIKDLYVWLRLQRENDANGGWVLLASRNEHIGPNDPPLVDGSVEAWARPPVSANWYGLTDNLKGRFATFIPPILEYLGLAEVEHNARNNRMRAII